MWDPGNKVGIASCSRKYIMETRLKFSVSSPPQNTKENKMANEDEGFSKEVTRFLDKNVGTEKSSATVVYSLLQNALKKKNCLETEVSDFEKRNLE